MTDTIHLGLPLIDASQAQKHVTHNEALRLLDAAIQIAVEDRGRVAPPTSPSEGARHIVGAGATGAWSGHAAAIASFSAGGWDFLAPRAGWCVWSIADDAMCVFDGAAWRDIRSLAIDNLARLGVNTTAASPNLLSVKSNAALLAAIAAAQGGSGDMRLQISKDSAANAASVVFADNYSGRAEFGLVGSDAFRLKVSNDGSSFVDALVIDQASGNAALPRGLALTGVIAPPQLTANQNDYAPASLGAAAVLQLSADAPRSLSGLAGGAEGRIAILINVGSQPISLLDDNASSIAANRFALGGGLTLAGKQAALLRYDATAQRWLALAGGLGLRADAAQVLSAAQQAQARANAGVAGRNYLINPSGEINQAGVGSQADVTYDFDQWLTLTQTSAVTVSQIVDAEDGTPFMMRALQPSATAQRFGRIQWLEKLRCRELRGQSVTLSARARVSAAATLRYAIVEWTGAADAIAKDVVADWTSASFIAGGFFASASTVVVATGATALAANTLTDLVPVAGTVSSAMNNLAVVFWTEATQPQNVSLDIARVKLEKGALATPFVAPSFDDSLAACQRYWCKSYDYATAVGTATRAGIDGVYVAGASTNNGGVYPRFPVRMRIAPTGGVTVYSSATGAAGVLRDVANNLDLTALVDLISERGFRAFTAAGSASVLLLDCHYTASARL